MGERLYNGVELPETWPPRDMDPYSDDPMPVPYLERPPAVIPIDVGRQLFVDDFLIEATDLRRTYHKPERHPASPILKPETAIEKRYPSVGFLQGGVFYNPAKGHFEMFYHSGHLEQSRSLHLATSTDLVNWQRPDLGLGTGNMFLPDGAWAGPARTTAGTAFAVWLDLNATDPDQRYKMLSFWGHRKPQPPGNYRHSLHTSPDGVHWSDAVLAGRAEDAQSLFYNPFRRVWVYSIKRGIRRGGYQRRNRPANLWDL